MRLDPLKQFARLLQQLLTEKAQIEARLSEINEAMGTATPAAVIPTEAPPVGIARYRRRVRAANAMSMREAVAQALAKGPLSRKELVQAVQDVGYVFKAKNPGNSLSVVLYGKRSQFQRKNGKFFLSGGSHNQTAPAVKRRRRKRTMSPEARAKIAAAQRARWARQRRGK